MRTRNRTPTIIFGMTVGILMTIFLAVKIAPFTGRGLVWIISNIDYVMTSRLQIVKATSKAVLMALSAYALGVTYYWSTRKNRRRNEEYGSAKWGNIRSIVGKYKQSKKHDRILSRNVRIGYNMQKHNKNLFTLVIGGSGAKKTRGYVIPNILQMSGSMIVLDPKGENVRACGKVLEDNGYDVKILDLIHMEKSHRYNPFAYITCENDIQRVATMIFRATGSKEDKASDPYWENAAQEILVAFMMYLWYEAPEEEQNFGMVMDMVRLLHNNEEKGKPKISQIDMLFLELKGKNPNHPALRYYEDFLGLPNKTLQTIKSTLTGKLSKFNLNEVISLTNTDELDIESLGRKKTAIFCVIPDMDTSFNFLVSVLYMQTFQRLAYIADNEFKGHLPVHVHFLMDEFSNVALPDDFEHVISTIRSRGVSMSIILQNVSQIKAQFKDTWESITGNCDETIYLGGNEQSTHKYVSELLGKETLDTNTYGKTHGSRGSFSTNDQQTGRELLTPDEVRMLDNDYCIIFIRGERPVFDEKYNIFNHKLLQETCLAKSNPKPAFEYGKVTESECSIRIVGYVTDAANIAPEDMYTPEDLDRYEVFREDEEFKKIK